MGKYFTDQQVQDFHENGFLPSFAVATPDLAKEMRSRLESFEKAQGGDDKANALGGEIIYVNLKNPM